MAFFGNKSLMQEKDEFIDQLQREKGRLNDEKAKQEDLIAKLYAEIAKLKNDSAEKELTIERLQESLQQTEQNLIYSRNRNDSLTSTIRLQEEEIAKLKDYINELDQRYYTISISDYLDLGLRRFSLDDIEASLEKVRRKIQIRNQEEIERKEAITALVKLLASYNNQRYSYIVQLIDLLEKLVEGSTRKTNAIFSLMYAGDHHQLEMMKRKMLESIRVKDICRGKLGQE